MICSIPLYPVTRSRGYATPRENEIFRSSKGKLHANNETPPRVLQISATSKIDRSNSIGNVPREIEARQNVSIKSNRLSFLSFSLLPLLDLDIRPCSPRIDNRHGARRAARYYFVYRGLTRPRGHLSNLPPRRDIGTVFSLNPRSIATVSQQVTPFAPGNSSIVLADCTLLFTRDKSFSSLQRSRLQLRTRDWAGRFVEI